MSASHRPRPGPPARRVRTDRPRRTAVLAATAGAVLLLDLVSKILVVAKLQDRSPVKLPTGYLWLTHARNSGAAFSFAEGATVLFTAVAVIVIVVIVRTASKLRSTAWAISLGLVLGGAAGNLVDRLFRSPGPLRGEVVDWISLRTPDGRMLFPIFNLADSGIVCGGILAVLLAMLGFEMDGTRGAKDGSPEPTPPPGPAAPSAGPLGPPSGPAGPFSGPPGPSAGPPGPFSGPLGPSAGPLGPQSAPPGPSGPLSGPSGPVGTSGPFSGRSGPSAGPAGRSSGPSGPSGPLGPAPDAADGMARPVGRAPVRPPSAAPPPATGQAYVPSRNPLAGPDGRARG
ncbi:MAG TPA: signal peptidase II [Mycobacteriales bacterium]